MHGAESRIDSTSSRVRGDPFALSLFNSIATKEGICVMITSSSICSEQSLLVATCRVISGGDDICKRHQYPRNDKKIVAARVSRIRLCLTRLPYQATFRARERGSTSLLISAHPAQTIVRISAPYRGGMKMVHLPANWISPFHLRGSISSGPRACDKPACLSGPRAHDKPAQGNALGWEFLR